MSTTAKDFTAQPLPSWRRAVLKVGSSLLAGAPDSPSDNGLDPRYAAELAQFIARARAEGREVVLVSSGAVAAGRGHIQAGGDGLVLRQALAALGQASLVSFWQSLSPAPVAQVLLTHDDLRHRRRYLNARAALRELLRLGALPVINENDTVAVDELKLGDNDNLAAAVASLVDADLLLIATDIGGLYSGHPQRDPTARPIERVSAVTPELLAAASGGAGELGTGGMRTKLEAGAKAAMAGIATALFCGRDAEVVRALGEGRLHGTLIAARRDRARARKQWLRHAPASGSLRIDAGAVAALHARGASLLPGGVVTVEGEFRRGDVIELRPHDDPAAPPLARGLAQYNAAETRRIAGRHSREIETLLGFRYGEEVVHRDDLVLLDTQATDTHSTDTENAA
ncbi:MULTISPECIES: glutamate 5-kinase [unclassified Lysobacter]|uniref:glutamate 5-kinase n=1 Tax=unclassified Lysobacter TaxID=2635362 RepID=UPI0006F77E53|nr:MULTISPECIES: glutamate 5-kinase [unclassified Lysobacter]KQZ56030.1 glutamate 5-kinase [Lysobacter sp. Root559]KRC31900.1 glutamate 5-kinase [Lysobacter sp. Root76]KRD67365.1 glutamate 5-kinase [Lysobacter sp. Root96]